MLWRGVGDFGDLWRSAALVLVFMLTRAWVAEPNVVLVVPLVLVLVSLGELDRRLFTALWVVPLAFTVVNASPLQLLWVAFPDAWRARWRPWPRTRRHSRLRAALVVAWQVAGWWTVVVCLRRAPAPAVAREAAA